MISTEARERPIKIAHVIYRLDVGGMETGLVNLINRLPHKQFSHKIICLTHATDFRHRILRSDTEIIELNKAEGTDLKTYYRFYQELRRIRPDIVHSRNLGTVDLCWISMLAGCPVRAHSEHGWDAADPTGSSRKYRRLRRLCDRAITRYIAMSQDIERWLVDTIGIKDTKVGQIYNGVDTDKFATDELTNADRGNDSGKTVFGTMGRQDAIKGLDVLLEAVTVLLSRRPELREAIEVVLAGDGPEHARLRRLSEEGTLTGVVTLPGNVCEPIETYRRYEFFVQPSLNEGISNTVLEAMSCSLGTIATRVGGNPELVRDGKEGVLVPASDSEALASAIENYIDDASLRSRHGAAARERAARNFSLNTMVESYERFYNDVANSTSMTGAD